LRIPCDQHHCPVKVPRRKMQARIQRVSKVVIEGSREDCGAAGILPSRQEDSYAVWSVERKKRRKIGSASSCLHEVSSFACALYVRLSDPQDKIDEAALKQEIEGSSLLRRPGQEPGIGESAVTDTFAILDSVPLAESSKEVGRWGDAAMRQTALGHFSN